MIQVKNKSYINRISSFMSVMMPFNLFYIVRNIIDVNFTVKDIIPLIAPFIFLVWGCVYSFIICKNDFSTVNFETGSHYNITEAKDITDRNILHFFCILTIIGVELGAIKGWRGMLSYIPFYACLMMIYAHDDNTYFNPILTVLGYRIYECRCTTDDSLWKKRTIYFIVKSRIITPGGIVITTPTNESVIRINYERR